MARLIPIIANGQGFVDEVRRTWDGGDAVLPVDPRLPQRAIRTLLDAMRAEDPIDDDAALVLATSGTTGAPKGVVHTHAGLAASATATSERLGVDPSRHRWLACLPLAHVGGLSVVTRAWHTGTPVVIHDGFDAVAVDAAATGPDACTHVSLVGTALGRVDADRWERIVLGGAAPPADRPAHAVATYGSTETGSGVVYDGVPLPGVALRIVPAAGDAASDGEIHVHGSMIADSYRDGTSIVDDDGWFATGDVGRIDNGVLVVRGRRDDLIITGGENVAPDPVEARLRLHPAIHDAAVVGRPDPEWGHRVVAIVEITPGVARPTLDELRDHVRVELPAWCAPKELVAVDALPRTALGKVRRAALRDGLTP